VALVSQAVEELRKSVNAGPDVVEVNRKVAAWAQQKPLRFGNAPDRDVQRFLSRGAVLMEELEGKLPFGLSGSQREVRDRCAELSKSMQKILDRRADEPQPFDPWKPVRIRMERPVVNEGLPLSAGQTRERYMQALKGCFPRGPAQADRARTQYQIWELNAERFHKDGPMNEAAQSWKRFMGVIDNMRSRAQAKGVVWCRVDHDVGIDFKPALQQQQSFRPRPRQRM
jgi:hypothetical protein